MKVKIIGLHHPNTWYKLGEIHEIKIQNVSKNCHEAKNGSWIYKTDCEVVTEPRLYRHEGKEYLLPEWVKFVTCDGPSANLIAWEKMPENIGKSSFHPANFQEYSYSKRETLREYIKPLPEGAFIVEV